MSLHAEPIPTASLTESQIERMFALFAASYDCVSRVQFQEDLAWKDEVLLLTDAAGRVQGFTTMALNPKGICHPAGDILFSGDTIIDPAHWGGSELVTAFCKRAGEWRAERDRRLFWMLISKGHRTYLFLPLFSKRYYPSRGDSEAELSRIANFAAEELFGDDWMPERGVVHFSQSQGQLKPELAEASWQRSHSPMVKFFLEKNPGFEDGDELVCMTELDDGNLKRAALRGFQQGMKEVQSYV